MKFETFIRTLPYFFFAATCFVINALLWLKVNSEGAASIQTGGKDFGVGILAFVASVATLLLLPAGLIFLAIGIAKSRSKNLERNS